MDTPYSDLPIESYVSRVTSVRYSANLYSLYILLFVSSISQIILTTVNLLIWRAPTATRYYGSIRRSATRDISAYAALVTTQRGACGSSYAGRPSIYVYVYTSVARRPLIVTVSQLRTASGPTTRCGAAHCHVDEV